MASEGEPALPAFGSVVFTLGKSLDNPGINAHVSVLFTQAPEGIEGETPPGMEDPPPEGSGKACPLPPPSCGEGTSGKEIMADPSIPPDEEVSRLSTGQVGRHVGGYP